MLTDPSTVAKLAAEIGQILNDYVDQQHTELMRSAGWIKKAQEGVVYPHLKRSIPGFAQQAAQELTSKYGTMTLNELLGKLL